MKNLLLVALLLSSAPAFADDGLPEGTAVAATTGADPDKAFDDAVDAHYKAMSDDPTCANHQGCHSKVVKKVKVKGLGEVDLRTETGDYGPVYAFVVDGGGGSFFAPDPMDEIAMEDCGAGNCTDEKLGAVTAKLQKGVLWITVTVKTRTWEDDGKKHNGPWGKYMIVYACQTGAAPKCAMVVAGGPRSDGSATVKNGAVNVKDENGKRTVAVTF